MAGPHRSAAIIAEIARQRLAGQLQGIESLDAKASTLIGFSGVVLGLVFTSPASDRWNDGLTAGVGLILLAILALGIALLPRRYKTNPNVLALRKRYLDSEPASTNLAIIDSIQTAVVYNADTVRWKVRALQAGTILAVVGILVMSASLLYSVNTDQPRTSQQKGSK